MVKKWCFVGIIEMNWRSLVCLNEIINMLYNVNNKRVDKYIRQDGVSTLSLVNTLSAINWYEHKFREQTKSMHTSIFHR